MTAARLLRFYPRPWRERYGDEFLATAGSGRLSMQQVIDITSGAIDAWLSTDVRNATRAAGATTGGGTMSVRTMLCSGSHVRYTKRDSLIGAAVMIGITAVMVSSGVALRRAGLTDAADMLTSLSFPVSSTLSMPFWLMKGQPWKAQAVIIGLTCAILIAMGYIGSIT
jgi:hypothetical protein